ncbi:hypothetical protein MTR_5g085705 [Medicago truncatula]|uniref:Uncharacterized protein n=1 Tax=Medicago truncatula TaxID=3880 RepID=A0A072UGS1_MEDTR|nr:hypothetical protein MTR_5g085705 [Medicago truncatula]
MWASSSNHFQPLFPSKNFQTTSFCKYEACKRNLLMPMRSFLMQDSELLLP